MTAAAGAAQISEIFCFAVVISLALITEMSKKE
jgi:hypothetical protein